MRERFSYAHPNDGAPRFCTKISPTLLPFCRCKFPHSLYGHGGVGLSDSNSSGGLHSDTFSGGNLRDRTNFGCRPEAFSHRPEYS